MKKLKAKAKENEMTTLLGGDEIEVTHLPVAAFHESSLKRLEKFQPLLGTSEVVRVRQVLVSDMRRYANALLYSDEAQVVEIYCGKEAGWADTLCPASLNAVADLGLELNLPFFGAWFQRQAKAKEMQMPPMMKNLQERLGELEKKVTPFSESPSPNSSGPLPGTTG